MEHMARTPNQIGNALRYERNSKGLTTSQVGEKYSLRQNRIGIGGGIIFFGTKAK